MLSRRHVATCKSKRCSRIKAKQNNSEPKLTSGMDLREQKTCNIRSIFVLSSNKSLTYDGVYGGRILDNKAVRCEIIARSKVMKPLTGAEKEVPQSI